jgi:hypothetical protein
MYSRHTLFGICLGYRNILGFLKSGNSRSRRKKIAPPQKDRKPPQNNRKHSQQPQHPAATAATTCALAFGKLGLMSVLEKAFKNRRTEPTWNNQHSRGYSRRTNEKVQNTEDNRGQLSTSLASNRI